MKNNIYNILWHIGDYCGCHRMPERSFFIGRYQFPVCARCTGVFVGYILFFLLGRVLKVSITLDFIMCFIMFFDWYLQYLNICKSTNIRRLITGAMCGFAYMDILIKIILHILGFIL